MSNNQEGYPMATKASLVEPRTLSGFMELLPEDQILFNSMRDRIKQVYELFGFAPIETPAIELAEVLLAKGGGETEKQIYRLTRGNTKLALPFDHTVPLARYVAQHQRELTFPFRRYQIERVWRAERAQKGRFREFYQCDIDIIGSNDPMSDAEIPSVIYAAFTALGFSRFTIRVNNRKVLNGFFEALGIAERSVEVLRVVDKLGKIGESAVLAELESSGIAPKTATQLLDFVQLGGSSKSIIAALRHLDARSALLDEGIEELAEVNTLIEALGVPAENFCLDLSIARGLDYYTGTVYETVLDDYPGIGSVCSGGRYNDLAGYYTETDLPGVGISIGLTRLFYQLKAAGLIQAGPATPAQVLVATTGPEVRTYALGLGSRLRQAGIPTEIYYEPHKIGRQLKYASKLGIPLVAIIGEDEVASDTVMLRDMEDGTQDRIEADALERIVQVRIEAAELARDR